jgi:hypothetical protein
MEYMACEETLLDRLVIFFSVVCRVFYKGDSSLGLSFLSPS